MANITIRNIPDSVLEKIRTLSNTEKRSINSELLLLIERGLHEETKRKGDTENILSKETQVEIWSKIVGKWKDKRSSKEIIEDIYKNRTSGRHIDL
jgi:plasmid stability protein